MTDNSPPDPITRILQTYDPILRATELRRFRLADPIRSPSVGTALVIERALGEPLVISPGSRIPDARTGNYRRMHLIDITSHGLCFSLPVPSADPAFYFHITVSFSCQITDPAAIARDGVHDMTAALLPSMASVVREIATKFDVRQAVTAEAAITSSLNAHDGVLPVRLDAFDVTMEAVVESDARQHLMQDLRREAIRSTLQGEDRLLLHHLTMHRDDTAAVIAALRDREQGTKETTQAHLDALRELLRSNNELGEQENSQITEQALSTFFHHISLVPSERGGIYERLNRQTRLDQWIATELTSVENALDDELDVDAGLRDAWLPRLRSVIEHSLADVLDVDAGLRAILPNPPPEL